MSPSLAKNAETPSIIAARLSSNPIIGWTRAELKEAMVRGVCRGTTKALDDMTETITINMRAIISIAVPLTISSGSLGEGHKS